MFEGAKRKLELAEYFLSNLKKLEHDAGGNLAYVKMDKRNEMRANLDGFFFELISAKDFFLQGINDKYADLPRDNATKIDRLKTCLICQKHTHVLNVVKSIEKELSEKDSWLWRINNYRNSATHRELMHFGLVATEDVRIYLFKDPEDPKQGNLDIEVIPYCDQSLKKARDFLDTLYRKLNI